MAGHTEWKWLRGMRGFLSSDIPSLLTYSRVWLNSHWIKWPERKSSWVGLLSGVTLQSAMEPHQWGVCPTVLSVQALHKPGRQGSKNLQRRNSIYPYAISSTIKEIIKCAWKARESNFAKEIWILWWNPGLVIFSLHHSKEAEIRTNNSYSIYLFGNFCKRVSKQWVQLTAIIIKAW